MSKDYLRAYRFFTHVFNENERLLLEYICKSIDSKNLKLFDSSIKQICANNSDFKRIDMFFHIINTFGHRNYFLYIGKLILANDNPIKLTKPQYYSSYNVQNRGYIKYQNNEKFDESFLGRLDAIKKYVIKKVEDLNEV